MNYQSAEQYLLEIPKFTKKNPIENTRKFIEYLGEMMPVPVMAGVEKAVQSNLFEKSKRTPMSDLTNVIHVAGTNGKGSVCAFLNQILIEAGYKVAMFTSPHLISMTERFRINGEPISEETFTDAFTRVKACVDAGVKADKFCHPTFFEFLVGMAYLIFTDENVDYIILETGLGGRLDATNLVKKPAACVITSIGYDHTEYLGDTLEAIAKEKAGIIKAGVPVIYDGNKAEVSGVIEQKAKEIQAKTYEVTMKNCEILNFGKKNIDFFLDYEYYNSMRVSLGTLATYQIMNAALAAVTIQTIDGNAPIPEEVVAKALAKASWPGRMEWLNEYFLIDGAHNEDGVCQAVESLDRGFEQIILLYSAVKDKEYQKIIGFLCGKLDIAGVVVTELDTPRGVGAEELFEIFRNCYDGPVYMEKSIAGAVQRAEEIRKEGIIFGTGSLYLVGELRKLLMK